MKTTHTHTPGKWKLGKRAGNPAIYGGKYGEEIAEILHELNADWQANAALISSAPELLEACKFALHVLRNPDADEYFVGTQLEEALEAAIAKAEGGEG